MSTKRVKSVVKFLSIVFTFALILGALPFVLYLKVLPWAISNPRVIKYVEDVSSKTLGADVKISNPSLKTSISPNINFKVDEIKLTGKNKKLLADIDKLNADISLKEIPKKNIILNKVALNNVFIDVNPILDLPVFKQKSSGQGEWNVDFYSSVFFLDNADILYKLDKNTFINVNGKKLKIEDDVAKKHLRYIISAQIIKGKNKLNVSSSDYNRVYIKDKDRIVFENSLVDINKSHFNFNGYLDKKNNYNLTFRSKNFSIPYVIDLLNSQIVENNLGEQLAYFKDIDGNFDFDFNITNKSMNGNIKLNKLVFKLIPFNNLPILLTQGNVKLDSHKIVLNDFKGYYNGKTSNKMDFAGTVKDYLKSVDTNLVGNAVVTNDFSTNYLSKMIGYPLQITGKADTRVQLKSKYNKIDLLWLYKFDKGNGFVADGDESFMNNLATRVLVAKMHFENMLLNIKSIDYYAEDPDRNHNVKKKRIPLVSFSSNIDFSNGQIFVKDFGLNLPQPMPSGFINMLIKEKLFKHGTFTGHIKVINTGKYPYLIGNMKMDKVAIPSQRLFIRSGELKTDDNHLHISSNGRYRRSDYDMSGVIINEIKFPIVVKNITLALDTVDVEKYLQVFNNQTPSDEASTDVKTAVAKSIENNTGDTDSDDNTQTFDLANLIVEECVLKVKQGFYKNIHFSDAVANLSLDKHSVLKINADKFNFAEGQTTAKINCDLKNHKYNIWLALIKVNSDLIATTLLNLPKEINGKASGLLDLNTDDSLKLNGRIQFRVYNGVIAKIGLVQYALNVASLFRNPLTMISLSSLSELVSVPEGKFDQIDGDIYLKNNIAERMMIKSKAPQLSSFIIGRYDIEKQDAALRIYTKFSNSKKGMYGFLRNISLNALANRIPLSTRNDSNYYSAEISQLPPIDAEDKDCQIFLTKVDGDIVQNNFLSSLKKIK